MKIRYDEEMIVNGRLRQIGKSFRVRSRIAGDRKAVFMCECGVSVVLSLNNAKSPRTKSCGCWKVEFFASGVPRCVKHGMSRTRIYRTWMAMKQRCENPSSESWEHYGGRGIRVCDRWLKFENFYEDMGDPVENMSIDRIDNNSGYSKGNCRWATTAEQLRNTRSNVMIEHNGVTKCASDWAVEFGLHPYDILNRIGKMSLMEAVSTPFRRKKK